MTRVRALPATRHAVYALSSEVLLVFKPRGHREEPHAHPHRQRLRVLAGRLEIRTGSRRVRLTPRSSPFTIAAGRAHATIALADTWIVAER